MGVRQLIILPRRGDKHNKMLLRRAHSVFGDQMAFGPLRLRSVPDNLIFCRLLSPRYYARTLYTEMIKSGRTGRSPVCTRCILR